MNALAGVRSTASIALDRAASVSGMVADGRERPLGGVEIAILTSPSPPSLDAQIVEMSWHGGRLTTRTMDGAFEVLDLEPYVSFLIEASSGPTESARVGPSVLSPGEKLSNIRIVLR